MSIIETLSAYAGHSAVGAAQPSLRNWQGNPATRGGFGRQVALT